MINKELRHFGPEIQVIAEPGRYLVRVALHQPKFGWFGVRTQAEVTVVAGPGEPASSPARAPSEVSTPLPV